VVFFASFSPIYSQPEDWRANLPEPVLADEPGWIALYYETWRLADMNRIQTPAGWAIGDCRKAGTLTSWAQAFVAGFGKYLQNAHPQIDHPMDGLDAFYALQEPDGTIPLILDEPNQNRIQMPIFAWAEWQYYLQTSDLDRLRQILPVLDRFYGAVKRLHGTQAGPYTSGYAGNGMSNRPLGTRLIDLTAQQALNAYLLNKMAVQCGEPKLAQKYEREHVFLSRAINSMMWNDDDRFYGDLIRDILPINHWSIAGYWPLLARVAEKKHVAGLLAALQDPTNFNTPHRIPTLGKHSIDYSPHGDFWRGSVYPPMNYMVIKGLDANGLTQQATEIAENHLLAIYLTTISYGMLYESYHQATLYYPSNRSRVDFVGWTGLSTIALLIENVIGVQVNAPEQLIRWVLHRNDQHGIKNLRWGPDCAFRADLLAQARQAGDPSYRIFAKGNTDFTLELICDNQSKRYKISAEKEREIHFP